MEITRMAVRAQSQVKGWMEKGEIKEAIEDQKNGAIQTIIILAAEQALVEHLGFAPDLGRLDMAIQEWANKARRYGKKMHCLSQKQIDWVASVFEREWES